TGPRAPDRTSEVDGDLLCGELPRADPPWSPQVWCHAQGESSKRTLNGLTPPIRSVQAKHMAVKTAQGDWLTAYLFFEDHVYGEAPDRVIREVVAPLVRACRPDAVRWFFLRYAEEGSHVRLRFFAPGPVLEETIWPRITEAASSSELVVRSTRELYEPEVE